MRVLVTYASRHGSTAEIADRVGEVLRVVLGMHVPDVQVDVLPVAKVGGVEGYDAVVVGSAVYLGRWLRPGRRFLRAEAARLRRRPVWLFSSGPVVDAPEQAAELGELTALFGAMDHRVFAGRLGTAQLGVAERTLVRAAHAVEGDFRDWAEVTSWAGQVADDMLLDVAVAR